MIITFILTIIIIHAGKHPHLWKVLLPVWGGGDQDGQGVGQQHHGGDQEHCWHDLGLGHGSILSRREWERRHRWESLGGYRASLIVRNLVRSSDRRTGDRYEDTLKYKYKYKYKYNPQIQWRQNSGRNRGSWLARGLWWIQIQNIFNISPFLQTSIWLKYLTMIYYWSIYFVSWEADKFFWQQSFFCWNISRCCWCSKSS